MAKIYSNSIGGLLDFVEKNYGYYTNILNSNCTYQLDFDTNTNLSLVESILLNPDAYSLIEGSLYCKGNLVVINPPGEEYVLSLVATSEYSLLPAWAKNGTAVQAETYINGQIFGGQTQAQVDAYIDATIKNITTANVAQINAQLLNIRTVLKAASAAIITMRSLFIITAKLLIYIRDLVIRFRK